MEKDAKRRRIEASGEATTTSLKVDYGNGIAGETLEEPLARYDYAAATALARQSAPQSSQGLLVTCPFRREKSATLELKAVLQQSCKGLLDGFRISLVKVHEGGKVFVRFAKKDEERPDATPEFNAVALVSTILQNEVPPRTTEIKFIERLFPVEAICHCEPTAIKNALVSILRSKEGRLKMESARVSHPRRLSLSLSLSRSEPTNPPLLTLPSHPSRASSISETSRWRERRRRSQIRRGIQDQEVQNSRIEGGPGR